MNPKKSIHPGDYLRKLLPNRYLKKTARETGVLQRQGKINVIALFWTLVLGFSSGTQKTFANLRRVYELQTGTFIPRSGTVLPKNCLYGSIML